MLINICCVNLLKYLNNTGINDLDGVRHRSHFPFIFHKDITNTPITISSMNMFQLDSHNTEGGDGIVI